MLNQWYCMMLTRPNKRICNLLLQLKHIYDLSSCRDPIPNTYTIPHNKVILCAYTINQRLYSELSIYIIPFSTILLLRYLAPSSPPLLPPLHPLSNLSLPCKLKASHVVYKRAMSLECQYEFWLESFNFFGL